MTLFVNDNVGLISNPILLHFFVKSFVNVNVISFARCNHQIAQFCNVPPWLRYYRAHYDELSPFKHPYFHRNSGRRTGYKLTYSSSSVEMLRLQIHHVLCLCAVIFFCLPTNASRLLYTSACN